MPDNVVKFDPARAETLARTARNNERLPGGTLFVELADQIEAAAREARGVTSKEREHNIAMEDLRRQLKDEREDFRVYRESTINYQRCLMVLKEIAGGAKGAKVKAQELLEGIVPKAVELDQPAASQP